MDSAALCNFCDHHCRLHEGAVGLCGVRQNQGGRVVTTVYGDIAAAAVDPIEKKPFYHFKPGTKTLSVALPGCNYHCSFCQNHTLSQYRESGKISGDRISPAQLVSKLMEKDLTVMTYTYSDPVVWQDYMLDTALLVKEKAGGVNCMVTNGSMSTDSLPGIIDLIDGFSIDFKGGEEFYRRLCGGNMTSVLNTIEKICSSRRSVVEVTTLIIEGIHSLKEIEQIGALLHDAGVEVWHLSRFFPAYKMRDRRETSEYFLHQALEIADESGIPFIYSGNSREESHAATRCPGCGTTLISSHSYGGEARRDAERTIRTGKCRGCGESIYGLF